MNKPQRIQTHSLAGQLQAHAAAGMELLSPPAHVRLNEEEMPFWYSIVEARRASSWNRTDLETAALLARAKYEAERLSHEVKEEGDVIINARGTPIANPKHSVLENTIRKIMSLSRILHVHAEATVGESNYQAKKNEAERVTRLTQQANTDGDLIPTMKVVNG